MDNAADGIWEWTMSEAQRLGLSSEEIHEVEIQLFERGVRLVTYDRMLSLYGLNAVRN